MVGGACFGGVLVGGRVWVDGDGEMEMRTAKVGGSDGCFILVIVVVDEI